MGTVILLGTGSALPTIQQENTYMALIGRDHWLLIDCAGSPYARLLRAGLNPAELAGVILTHGHPDHVYGLPALLMDLWLAGRREPLQVYGPAETCGLASANLALYQPQRWPEMYAVAFHDVALDEGAPVCETSDYEVIAMPTQHMVPGVGLRVTDRHSDRRLAYSGDTEPGPGILALARGADLLIHEASGAGYGHSSARQAGALAREAGVPRLLLVHYNIEQTPPESLEREAAEQYDGEIHVARDFERFTW